jgi:hypothetical protein
VDHEGRLAGLERDRALPPLALQLGAARAELAEVELVDEEPPGALEVVHVVVQRFDLPDAEGLALRHPRYCNVDCRRREPTRVTRSSGAG